MFRVTLSTLIDGDPRKAWRGGGTPNDVWQDQAHDFDDLDAAKSFVRNLPGSWVDEHGTLYSGSTVTHVVLTSLGTGPEGADEVLYAQDFGHDDLEAAAPGVVPASLRPAPSIDDDGVYEEELPPLLPAQ